jgi:prepilin-type N-terminal cleavage/methylation domain-containing protein
MTKKFGFTLAEVLITLGIIGVVAAMTIPTLIANTNGAKFRSQFKKSLSTLNQAGLMAKAQYDFDYADASSACGDKPGEDNPTSVMTFCSLLNGTLTGQTYLGTVSDAYANAKSTSDIIDNFGGYYLAYSLADGSIVAFNGGSKSSSCTLSLGQKIDSSWIFNHPFCLGFIDVNGVTLPNKVVSGKTTTSLLGLPAYADPSDGEEGEREDSYHDADAPVVVPNNANYMTDIFPIIFHDATVEAGSGPARYVLSTAK